MSVNKENEEIDEYDDFEFDGVGLVPVYKQKEEYTEPLFLIYFNESGGTKGKFKSMAVDKLDIRFNKSEDNTPKELKYINLAVSKNKKYFYVYNSTNLDIDLKRELSSNYLISLTAQEYKRIYETNGLVDSEGKIIKESCFFSLKSKIITSEKDGLINQEIFILKKSDIPVPVIEQTEEQINEKELVSVNGKAIHKIFKKYCFDNGYTYKNRGEYMELFHPWNNKRIRDEKFRAYAELKGKVINTDTLYNSNIKIWDKEQAKIKKDAEEIIIVNRAKRKEAREAKKSLKESETVTA